MEKIEYIKEFKVRMDQIKCEKYKTFQPELPTKKFLFSDEKDSIHNMKLLGEDSSDQNKSTTIHGEKAHYEETVTEQQPKEDEEVRKAVTGMFRDNIRRIDLVLVVEDDVNELINNMKMDFLSYIVRAGLEVEIEPGVLEKHRNLTFIKIHAPDSVLEKYGKFFGTKRYFADTRYDYMNKAKKYEKEWVMLVRNNYNPPNGFSNYERSIIVYKILLHLSFGDHANDYGIERLLKKKVIADVFALHDGPYFITPDQTISGSNGRQILNYYWSRLQNLFQRQPIHLIHEYFGPTLAFYFAFYEFFTKALKVAALLGILNIILGTLNLTVLEKAVENSICKSTVNICKSCTSIICPQRPCTDYCLSVKIHLILDHLLIPLYLILTVIGAFMFLRLWQRREYFLRWMWEVGRHDSYYKNAVRPLFTGYGFGYCARTDPFIGGFKYSESFIPILFRNVISKIIVILHWYYIIPIMYFTYPLYLSFCKRMRVEEHYEKYRDYIVMSMFQAVHIICHSLIEKIYHYIIYFLVKIENHSSYRKFEESIVVKKIGFRMLGHYTFIAFYAWIYGHQIRYGRCRLLTSSFYVTYSFVMYTVYGYKNSKICDAKRFCFPYSCIIEVATLLGTLLVVTQVIHKLYDYICSLKTDYNQSVYGNYDIPCWEREYRLSSVTEEHIIQKYVDLAAQFSLVTWFVISFPLAPLILYLINIWDMRHQARKLLLASRRPLLIKTPGSKFIKAFYFIALFSVITNAINLTTITRSVLRYVMFKLDKQPSDLYDFMMYDYEQYGCSATDIIIEGKGNIRFYDLKKSIFYRPEFFQVLLFSIYHMILFIFATGCAFIIIHYTISRQREVRVARKMEEKVRKLYYCYEHEYKDPKGP